MKTSIIVIKNDKNELVLTKSSLGGGVISTIEN